MDNIITVDDVLDAIHFSLIVSGVKYSPDIIKEQDEKIVPFILENIKCSTEKRKFVFSSKDLIITPDDLKLVLLEYVAQINNNRKLLQCLIDKNYSFNNRNYSFSLFVLDSSLSSRFDLSTYVNLVLQQDNVLKGFFQSLKKVPDNEKNKYIVIFSSILNYKKDICKDGKEYLTDFLTVSNIKRFGEKNLLKMNICQKRFLNKISSSIDDSEALIIKDFFEKYPKFPSYIPIYSGVFNDFSYDELVCMSEYQASIYKIAFSIDCISFIKKVFEINPDFKCPDGFIKRSIIRNISSQDMAKLSFACMEEILLFSDDDKKISKLVKRDLNKDRNKVLCLFRK